jgi:hypothetical protein
MDLLNGVAIAAGVLYPVGYATPVAAAHPRNPDKAKLNNIKQILILNPYFLILISIGLMSSTSLQEADDIQVDIPALGRINLFKINQTDKKNANINISFITTSLK